MNKTSEDFNTYKATALTEEEPSTKLRGVTATKLNFADHYELWRLGDKGWYQIGWDWVM